MPVLFNGDYLITPTVVSSVNDDRMFPSSNPSGNTLALIGESDGGVPKKPIRIRSPYHAKQLLRRGPLYEGALRAFNPMAVTGSPASVLAVRVNPALQSTATLKDASGNDTISLKSADYGTHTETLDVRIETGSHYGLRISIRQNGDVFYRDNVNTDVIKIKYNGTAASSQVKVANGVLSFEAPVGTVVKTYDLINWNSGASIIEAINDNLPDWTASLNRGQERFAPINLDGLTLTNLATEQFLTGAAFNVVNFFNGSQEILIDANIITSVSATPPATSDWVNLQGGRNGNTTIADWEEAFGALSNVEAQWIVPLTDAPSVWDMAVAHVTFMSRNKRERRVFIGAANNITAEQAQMHAYALNSDRAAYVWPGVLETDPLTRELVLVPAYMAAVNIASGFAAITPGTTLSRQALSVAGAEVILNEPADTDGLIESGVCALVQGDQGVIISQAITTWQADQRYNRREISVGAAVDYVARVARNSLTQLRGMRASHETIAAARSIITALLSRLSVAPPSGPGILVGNPGYRNIIVELNEDVLKVSFECSPVMPLNYILIPISISPFRGA